MKSSSIRQAERIPTRPELQRMMDYVRKGDTVIVESISRFARNTRDLLELVEQFNRQAGRIRLQEGGH